MGYVQMKYDTPINGVAGNATDINYSETETVADAIDSLNDTISKFYTTVKTHNATISATVSKSGFLVINCRQHSTSTNSTCYQSAITVYHGSDIVCQSNNRYYYPSGQGIRMSGCVICFVNQGDRVDITADQALTYTTTVHSNMQLSFA